MTIIKNHDTRAIIVLILLWLIFFWRILTPVTADQASFKQGDFSGQFVAFSAYQYDRMSQGQIPLWNPYNNGGLPFIGDTQAAVFYPPRLITIAIAKLWGGWSYHALELEAIVHVLFYSLFMYAFIRRLTNSVWGAFVSAIVAAYGGYTAGYPPLQLALLEAAIWLPLGALCIYESTMKQKIQWMWLVLAGFSLGLSWMAGHPQTSWFLTYFMVAWLGYRIYEQHHQKRHIIFGTVLMGIISLGITAITFIPAAQYLSMTVRSGLGFDAKLNGFPFQDIAQLIFPASVSAFSPLYVGIPALILIAIASIVKLNSSRFWLATAIFGLALSFGGNSALYHILYYVLPGLYFFRGQERVAFLIVNSLAILAGIGMATLQAGIPEKYSQIIRRITMTLSIVIGIVTSLIYIGWWGNIGNGFGQLVGIAAFSTMIAFATWLLITQKMKPNAPQFVSVVLVVLIVFELFSVNIDADTNYDPMPPTQQLSMNPTALVQSVLDDAPDEPFRVDGFRGVQANYGSLYQVMDIRGISPLFLDDAWQIIYRDYVNNPRAWEIFAVRYIFSERDSFGQVETEVIAQGTDRDGQVFIHEIVNPRPFAHLIYDVAVVGSDEHAIELLFDPNLPLRDTIILQQEPSLSLPDAIPENAQVTVTTFEPETVAMTVDTPENAILSLAMVDYSGWSAKLDGDTVEILRAYGSLSAIEVPAGQHSITLTYDPLSYRIGAMMSIITWLSVISSVIVWGMMQLSRNQQEHA